MDPTQTILVHLKLDKENFEYFHCKHKIVVGIKFKLIFHDKSNVYNQFSLFWHENAYSKYYQEIKTIFMNIHKEGHQLQMHLYITNT